MLFQFFATLFACCLAVWAPVLLIAFYVNSFLSSPRKMKQDLLRMVAGLKDEATRSKVMLTVSEAVVARNAELIAKVQLRVVELLKEQANA